MNQACSLLAFPAVLMFATSRVCAAGGAPLSEPRPLDYAIVVTGGELLAGLYPDTHTHYLTRILRPVGCRCVSSMTVDDNREDIQQALRVATNRAPLVLVTGGLGPTPNDITRETLAEFTGIRLEEHPDVLADMERRFNQPKDQLRPNLRRQALVPSRGGYLKNPNGTAVGLIFDCGASVIVALPGPPRELQPMVKNELAPYLGQRFGVRGFGCSITLRFVGIGQSLIDQTIKDHVSIAPDVTVTSLFEGGRVDFTFALPGNTPADQARLKRLGESLREHLNEYLYADDGSTLEDVVVRKLLARGGSLVLVEVGSGGHLAAAFSLAKGTDRLLAGAYTAPTGEAMARLLQIAPAHPAHSGEEQVKVLASAAAKLARSEWAIAVGPIEPDGRGGKRVWVAFQSPVEYWDVQQVTVRNSGEIAGSGLITPILDRLRRQLK